MMQEEEIIYEDLQMSEVQNDTTIEEVIQVVEVTDVETFDIEMSEAFPASGEIDALNHALLYHRELDDAHPISAITGLREELNSIEALQTIYSDKKGNADYYEWADGHAIGENGVGYFVTLNNDACISICTGDDIFGVVVDRAAFVGGQDDVARDDHYGLVATTGVVPVRRELDVAEGDYVISNSKGWAAKATSDYGYKVVALRDIQGVPHAIIKLNISADQMHLIGAEIQDLDSRMDAAETNIVSAVNVANQAYQKAVEAGSASTDASNKAQNALDTSNKVLDSMGSLENAATQSQIIAAQAKAIAEGTMVSAEAMCKEAVDEANKALVEAEKIREEFNDIVGDSAEDLSNAVHDLKKLKEDLTPLAMWPEGTDIESATGYAGFVAQANEDSSILGTMVGRKGEQGETLAGFIQEAEDTRATVKGIVSYEYTDKDGKPVTGAAGLMAQVDATQSEVSAIANREFTKNDGTVVTGLAGLNAYVNENESNVSLVANRVAGKYTIIPELVKEDKRDTSKIYGTYDSETKIVTYYYYTNQWNSVTDWVSVPSKNTSIIYYVSANKLYWYYDNNIWKSTDDAYTAGLPSAIAGIQVETDDNSASINSLISWQGETNISIARIEQKADANGAYIQSTVANLDRYAVGPYSQAYGFTLEQAAEVLEEGMIYAPTTSHTEKYKYTDTDETVKEQSRSFVPRYLYKWGKVGTRYGWITVDKNYNETTETNTSGQAVYFTTEEPTVSGNFGYWYTDGDTVTGTIPGTDVKYEPYTLYKWTESTATILVDGEDVVVEDEDGNPVKFYHWAPVATLAGNSQSRAVSQIRQDANSIEMSVADLQGNYAGVRSDLTNTQAAVQQLSEWKTGEEANMATVKTVSDANGASVVISALQKKGDAVEEMASLVLNVVEGENGTKSGLSIDADYINFTGSSFDVAIVDSLNQKIDNIKIGGTNLISISDWAGGTSSLTPIANNSQSGFGIVCPGGKTQVLEFGRTKDLDLKPNTDYVISFVAWIETSNSSETQAMNCDLYPDNLPEFCPVLTSTPTKFTQVMTSPHSDMHNAVLRFFSNQLDASETYYVKNAVYITDIKLEEGNKATNWSAAPEDRFDGANLFVGYGDEEIRLGDYQNQGSFTQFEECFAFNPCNTVGEVYTISFWAKSPNGTTELKIYNSIGPTPKHFMFNPRVLTNSLGNAWTYFTTTIVNQYNGNGTSDDKCNRIEIYAPNQMGVLVKKIKVERGYKATEWCPASVGTHDIITRINASKEGVTIQGSKVDITGNLSYQSFTETTTEKFKDYSTTTEMNTAIKAGVDSIDLSAYAKQETLQDYATTSGVNSQLANYAKTSMLNDYAKASALSGYVTNTTFNSSIADYVKTSVLNSTLESYSTTSEMNSALSLKADSATLSAYAKTETLANYATNDSVSNQLKSYATTSAMNSALSLKADSATLGAYATTSALANYATNDSVTNTLKNYPTTGNLNDRLKNYSTTTEMNSALALKADSATLSTYAKTETLANYATTSSVDNKLKSYATTSEMNSALSLKADSATLSAYAKTSTLASYATNDSVDNKLKNYSTTTEMNSALSLKADSATLSSYEKTTDVNGKIQTVEGKLALGIGTDTDGKKYAYLNANADKIKFDATKTIEISASNFTLKPDGEATIKSGTIGGWNIKDSALDAYRQIGTEDGKALYEFIGMSNTLAYKINSIANPESTSYPAFYAGTTKRFGQGDENNNNLAKFMVLRDGSLYASAATINGNFVASMKEGGYRFIAGHTFITPTGSTWTFDKVGVESETDMDGMYFRPNKIDVSLEAAKSETTKISFGYDAASQTFYGVLNGDWVVGSLMDGSPVTSDRNKKNSIQEQSEVYTQIFDNLIPVTYKYNHSTSDRIHTGFIAQDVEDAVLSVGLTTKDFAAVCYDVDEEGNKSNYRIRYEELVSLCVYEIQKLKARVAELEAQQNDSGE